MTVRLKSKKSSAKGNERLVRTLFGCSYQCFLTSGRGVARVHSRVEVVSGLLSLQPYAGNSVVVVRPSLRSNDYALTIHGRAGGVVNHTGERFQ